MTHSRIRSAACAAIGRGEYETGEALALKSGIDPKRLGRFLGGGRLTPDEAHVLARCLGLRDDGPEPLWTALARFAPDAVVVRLTAGHAEVVALRRGVPVREPFAGRTIADVVTEIERVTEGRAA